MLHSRNIFNCRILKYCRSCQQHPLQSLCSTEEGTVRRTNLTNSSAFGGKPWKERNAFVLWDAGHIHPGKMAFGCHREARLPGLWESPVGCLRWRKGLWRDWEWKRKAMTKNAPVGTFIPPIPESVLGEDPRCQRGQVYHWKPTPRGLEIRRPPSRARPTMKTTEMWGPKKVARHVTGPFPQLLIGDIGSVTDFSIQFYFRESKHVFTRFCRFTQVQTPLMECMPLGFKFTTSNVIIPWDFTES